MERYGVRFSCPSFFCSYLSLAVVLRYNRKRITETLGFTVAPLEGGDPALKPRVMDYNEPGGREEEARQLRMWVEVSAWTAEYARKNSAWRSTLSLVMCGYANRRLDRAQA